jgi:chorismate-pyruvate lyase
VTGRGPSPLPRLLRDNPDTVTHLLEALTGEPLVADVVRQHSMAAEVGSPLGLGGGQPVTHRIAVLKGAVTKVAYVYAESAFVPARLPEAARLALAHTSDPIGRVLAACGMALVREDLPTSGSGAPQMQDAAASGVATVVWFRAYRLTLGAHPVFAIREWFFRSVQDALERAMPV